ncbi:MAG: class I SAM-dependent methyltransferase [Rhodocyclaceae bacterium]|nr:class I SAM-dependent methyltransferase [Rhodocyclaceae bacterium]
MSATITLQPGREKSVLRRHPWLFETSIAHFNGRARAGDTVDVLAADGRRLGRAAWSPRSQIRARMWHFDPVTPIDDAFFRARVAAAWTRRGALGLVPAHGLRVLHAESDGLPGVIADAYGDTVVLQLTSAGADKWRAAIVSALLRATGCARVYERSDSDVRGLEGLAPECGWRAGQAGDGPLEIVEHGLRMEVDIQSGHKTGFYLDQRDNRALTARLAAGRRVLNCFCYTGGFSLAALAGGASEVLSIDSSGPALQQAQRNLALNPALPAARAEWLEADVFTALRDLRKAGRRFDLIVLDPPKFAPSASHAASAARAYKDINLNALRLLEPGGLLLTYSCSGGIGVELFQKIVAGAALDAGVDGRVLARLGPGPDHPVGLAFPEGEYLKGLLCQI